LVIIFADKQLIFVDEQASYTNIIRIGRPYFEEIILNIETINTNIFVSESSWKTFDFNIIMQDLKMLNQKRRKLSLSP